MTSSVQSASAGEPAVGKLGVVFHLKPHFNKPEWTWTPQMRFKVSGPIASSNVITVEYTYPNGRPFAKVECENVSATGETEFLTINDCGYRLEDNVATNQTGVFGFSIKLSDSLAGTNKVLFGGKFTVGKQLYNPDKLPAKTKQFYYYVDQDWRLPVGYVGTWFGDTSNDVYAEVWIKKNIVDQSKINGYLYFNGKQVSEASAGIPLQATPPETPAWEYHQLQLKFRAITEKPPSDGWDGWWKTYENPGNYEIKVLRDGKLIRSLKFVIGADGKPTHNDAAKNIGLKLGSLVPVNVIDGDGTWRKDAWKTEALFGNPLTGFAAP